MNGTDFKRLEPVKIGGRTLMLYRHLRLNWWRLGGRNVQAVTKEEAIAKFNEISNKGAQLAK